MTHPHAPTQVTITVTCKDLTEPQDVIDWDGKLITPTGIYCEFRGLPGAADWELDVYVTGTARLFDGRQSRTIYAPRWWRDASDEGSLHLAPGWVAEWVTRNTPPAALIPQAVS